MVYGSAADLYSGSVFGVTAPMTLDPVLRGITVIMAGMPAPVTTALLSSKYHGDERYATGMIFFKYTFVSCDPAALVFAARIGDRKN